MISLIIAAPMSGSGKTTVTLGLMAALMRRGLSVAPFKVGPDFIDPGYHRLVTGRPSVNLDGWMCDHSFVRQSFARHTASADVAVIEGVMGLFDGVSGSCDDGSTAQVARLLEVPVILVVDARSQARSAAALVKGFAEFDPRLRLAGVIFNNVGSDNHARILREAVASLPTPLPVFGCLPRDEQVKIPSRHLGLVTADDNPLTPEFQHHLAEIMERNLDLDGMLAALPNSSPGSSPERSRRVAEENIKIAVARDAAFCFVYDDNLRLLREAGAEIVEFSPLSDPVLPEGIAGIYLPGGYPELFADTLAANGPMKRAIGDAVEIGMPVYAECGGFIYLTKGLAGVQQAVPGDDSTGHTAPREFVGIFPVTARMLPRRKALGYREVELTTDSLLGPAGTVARGHEFHYSEIGEMPEKIERSYRVRKQGVDLGEEGYLYKNCLASYVHLHFGSNPGLATAFVSACREAVGQAGP
jgi:cobyrinic acid a,c-diamide synthase